MNYEQFEEATMNYQQREEAKQKAREVFRDSDASLYKMAFYAVHYLITAHYWRAREAVDNAPASFRRLVHGKRYSRFYQLDIDVYTRHWLWANGDELLPPGVAAEIAKIWYYEPEQHKMMPKRMSMYGFYGERPYEASK